MEKSSSVLIYLDNDAQPIGEYKTPIHFELDSTKLVDGEHVLKIISKGITGKEGIRNIPFIVRNGPSISIEGLNDYDLVDGVLPLMINAYSKGDQKEFLIEGSETPQSIPAWLWIIIILFIGWSIYYTVISLKMPL